MTKKLIRITTVPVSLDKLLEGQLRFMSDYYEVIAVSSDKPYLEKIGLKENVETFHLEMTRQITPIKDLIAIIKLYKFLKKTKPTIVHTHTPKAGTVGMIAAKLAGVPNRLHTIAGLPLLESKGLKRKLLNAVEKITYACATNIYPNSFGLLEIIKKEKFTSSDKLKVLANGSSNGINTSYFNPDLYSQDQNENLKKSLNIEQNDFIFIFVGRLVKDKGINELIKGFERLSKERSNVKLLLLGKYELGLDPLKPETLDIINLNKCIISLGYQKDVRPFLAIADALVFPSYREGFPNVVMQAGAMGIPSIVSNINGCNEIIIDKENGLIIPVKNQESIFIAMNKLLDNKKGYLKMKQNARIMIVSRFKQQLVWNAILEEYKLLED